MITRIELTNFMSHTSTVIEPSPGLTVFVGPNNCGKSAVFSAIECTLHCIKGDYMKRHDATSCSVAITMSDGVTLGFRRGKGSSTLTLNGESGIAYDHDGCARLSQATKLPTIDVGGTSGTIDVHFRAQKQPLFLVDASESVIAKFFASSSDAGKLLEMKRRLAARQQDDQRTLKRLDTQVTEREKVLATLEPVPAIEEALNAATSLRDALIEEQRAIVALGQRIDQLAKAQQRVLAVMAQRAAMAELRTPPLLHDDAAATQVIERFAHVSRECEGLAAQWRVVHGASAPPALVDELPLTKLAGKLSDAIHAQRIARAEHDALCTLAVPPTMHDTSALEAAAGKFAACEATLGKARAELSVLARLGAVPMELDVLPLRKLGVDLKNAATKMDEQQRERDALGASLKEAAEAVNEAMRRLGACPVCERPFSAADHVHGGAS